MRQIEVKKVIITELDIRGAGTPEDPVRRIKQIWDMDGNLITEIDPYNKYRKEWNCINEDHD